MPVLLDYSSLEQGMAENVLISTPGVDPFSVALALKDPDNETIFEDMTPVKDGVGNFHYFWLFTPDAKIGTWTFTVEIVLSEGVDPEVTNLPIQVVAGDNLCTLWDVKNEGLLSDETLYLYRKEMQSVIDKISREINKKKKGNADHDDLLNCGVFYVLNWMEDHKLIATSRDVSSESEGDESVSYVASDKLRIRESYQDKYLRYRAAVLPVVLPGKAGRRF